MNSKCNESKLVYISKINKVQDYIEKNIDEELSIEQLAKIANFSKFHFQRIYRYMTGESLYSYIKRLRLEKATFLLLANNKRSIQDIALSVGFSNQASFAKAFREKFGMSASKYRSLNQFENMQMINNVKEKDFSINGKVYDSKIRYTRPIRLYVKPIKDTRVIYIRHTGPYEGNGKLFEELFLKLYSFTNSKKYIRNDSKWFVVYHDFDDLTMEEQLRISVCMSINEDIQVDGEFGSMILEGGKYVVGRFLLKSDEYKLAWNYMLSKWLPQSGYIPDDRMCFEYYPPQGCYENKEEKIVDIFIPITPL
ncbi:AraC family transcriptional regulator [Clostridium sp. D2Q-14]|uniref:AraC family transcriptional regulator n=1 Tax=Anaeromonas gelatinilytica TaxID=2683194 RepID=UPI00193C2CC9|nr:GyrI-like domain-containing protein [Anaeromonas gelatinilytica]MBS4536544.1 AraC family transcriptional regulator [Anaeromonas gelatinilytica]